MSEAQVRWPLSTRTWRTGRPVLFIHGLGGSARYWERVARTRTGWGATAVDLLGFGNSPKPDVAYDLATHVEAIRPHVADGAVIVAHSTGCAVAAALAARCQRHIAGLVLVGTPAFEDEDDARRRIGSLGPLARWTVDGRARARLLCHTMCHLRPLAMWAAPALLPDLPPAVARDGAKHTWISYSRTLEQVVVAHRIADDLRLVEAPVRFVHGTDDRTAPIALARGLAERAGGDVAFHAVEGGDHHVALRQPEDVATVIDELAARGT